MNYATLYSVQCWNDKGARVDQYDTWIGSAKELRDLREFLERKYAKVVIAKVPKERLPKHRMPA